MEPNIAFLTMDQFRVLRDLVQEEAGIFLKDEKKYFIENRLTPRLEATSCNGVDEYMRFLKFDRTKSELYKFIDCLTTNETYFFRDKYQIDNFSDEVLPKIIENKKKKGESSLRIWSAGCSTGEEPYTLSMILQEKISELYGWKVQIFATDISERVLSACRAGIYDERALKDTPEKLKAKYFTKSGNLFRINPEIKQNVLFSKINLFNRGLMRTIDNIDIIFCRNVLIYFTHESVKKVVNSFYDSLVSGGIIILGHSESMTNYSSAFKMIKNDKTFTYMKE